MFFLVDANLSCKETLKEKGDNGKIEEINNAYNTIVKYKKDYENTLDEQRYYESGKDFGFFIRPSYRVQNNEEFENVLDSSLAYGKMIESYRNYESLIKKQEDYNTVKKLSENINYFTNSHKNYGRIIHLHKDYDKISWLPSMQFAWNFHDFF